MPAWRIQPAAAVTARLIDAGALRSAGDQQDRQVRLEAEVRPRLVPGGQPVQPGYLPPDRDADAGGVREPGAGLPGKHMRGEQRADPVGQAGTGVRLVHHDRDSAALGRQVARGGHVAAEAHQHLGARLVQDLRGRPDGGAEPPGDRQQLRGHRARQRHRGNQRQVVTAQRDQPGLQAALGTQAGDRHLDGQRAAARRPAPARARYGPPCRRPQGPRSSGSASLLAASLPGSRRDSAAPASQA